jgi:hypothetical protein
LQIILKEEDARMEDYIIQMRNTPIHCRSVSVDIDLEPGRYEVIPKIVPVYDPNGLDVCEVVKKMADQKPFKLRQIGMNYDIAHAKGIEQLTAAEKEAVAEKKRQAERDKA